MIEVAGRKFITGSEAAAEAGVTVQGLAMRRNREGLRHPRCIAFGGRVLYEADEFRAYVDTWVDRRRR